MEHQSRFKFQDGCSSDVLVFFFCAIISFLSFCCWWKTSRLQNLHKNIFHDVMSTLINKQIVYFPNFLGLEIFDDLSLFWNERFKRPWRTCSSFHFWLVVDSVLEVVRRTRTSGSLWGRSWGDRGTSRVATRRGVLASGKKTTHIVVLLCTPERPKFNHRDAKFAKSLTATLKLRDSTVKTCLGYPNDHAKGYSTQVDTATNKSINWSL